MSAIVVKKKAVDKGRTKKKKKKRKGYQGRSRVDRRSKGERDRAERRIIGLQGWGGGSEQISWKNSRHTRMKIASVIGQVEWRRNLLG